MLTVKIRKTNGDEALVEATHVLKERNGILVYGPEQMDFYGPGGQMYAYDAEIRDYTAPTDELDQHGHAWVMNSHGATVAHYEL